MSWRDFLGGRPGRRGADQRRGEGRPPGVEALEGKALLSARAEITAAVDTNLTPAPGPVLLQRAAAATASNDAIIAVVDRGGNVLGVRAEAGVSPAITGNTEKLVFAVDGALA